MAERHNSIREGVYAGVIGATAIAVWFAIIDVAHDDLGGGPRQRITADLPARAFDETAAAQGRESPREIRNQLFARTVRDELRFGPRNLGYPPAQVDALVERAGLGEQTSFGNAGIIHHRGKIVSTINNANRAIVQGKRIVLIDDSIVRGTTSMKIVQMMRDAGAREVHLRVASPPTRHSCFYGVDTPERTKLLAHKLDVQGMTGFIHL